MHRLATFQTRSIGVRLPTTREMIGKATLKGDFQTFHCPETPGPVTSAQRVYGLRAKVGLAQPVNLESSLSHEIWHPSDSIAIPFFYFISQVSPLD